MNLLTSIPSGELVIISSTNKRFLTSIRTKLFAAMVAIGVLPMLLLAVMLMGSIRADSREQMSRDLLRQANTISTHLSVTDYLENQLNEEFIENIMTVSDYRFVVINNLGETVYDTNPAGAGKVYSSTEVLQILLGNQTHIITDEGNSIVAYVPVYDRVNQEVAGVIMIKGSTTEIEYMIARLTGIVSLMFLGIVMAILVLNAYFTGILSRPFSQLLNHVRRVSEGHISERIHINGNYEIEEIGHAFNEMLDTIEAIDSSRQQFVANVSHELKTPLSSMKVLAEALLIQEDAPIEFYREFMEDISSEVDRETQIINDLLTLVSLDKSENKLNLAPLNLNRLVEQVMRMLKPVAEKQGIVLEIKSYREVNAMLDETKVYLVLMNLIENAIKYNRDHGKVTVSINADHRETIVKVTDTGIGIPEESVNRIFDRFYRVDKARSRDTGGTGLGLNIVHKTVLMHGGTIKCTSREDEGTTFTVRLPLSQVSPDDETVIS